MSAVVRKKPEHFVSKEPFDPFSIEALSAGANGVFDTTFDDRTFDETLGGDDVGHVIRASLPN